MYYIQETLVKEVCVALSVDCSLSPEKFIYFFFTWACLEDPCTCCQQVIDATWERKINQKISS